MISKVEIQNFQSHQNTVLELDPGVNTIIGTSDSGKTAVFRAITWVMTNRPLGASFRSWGSKKTQVTLTVDDLEVGRTKSNSENNYLFKNKELLAGTEVPEDIQKALKINPLINIQGQMSPPFLLSSSPGEVASFFNDVAGLSDIDKSIKNLKSWQIGSQRAIKQLELEVQKYESQIEGLQYLDEAEEDIKSLETAVAQFEQLNTDQKKVADLIHKHFRCSETLAQLKNSVDILLPVEALIGKTDELVKLERRIVLLAKAIREYNIGMKTLLSLEKRAEALSDLKVLEEKIQTFAKKQIKIISLRTSWTTGVKSKRDYIVANLLFEECKIKLTEMMPDQCPLCGSEVNHEKNN